MHSYLMKLINLTVYPVRFRLKQAGHVAGIIDVGSGGGSVGISTKNLIYRIHAETKIKNSWYGSKIHHSEKKELNFIIQLKQTNSSLLFELIKEPGTRLNTMVFENTTLAPAVITIESNGLLLKTKREISGGFGKEIISTENEYEVSAIVNGITTNSVNHIIPGSKVVLETNPITGDHSISSI